MSSEGNNNIIPSLIEEVEKSANQRSCKGDKNSLLCEVNKFKSIQQNLNPEYIDFHNNNIIHKKCPECLVPRIFSEIKKEKDLHLEDYKRDEKRDSRLIILKGCEYYNPVFKHIRSFGFIRTEDKSRYIEDCKKPTNFIWTDELKSEIQNIWHSTNEIDDKHKMIFEKLLESSSDVYEAVIFEYQNDLFVLMFKAIKTGKKPINHQLLSSICIDNHLTTPNPAPTVSETLSTQLTNTFDVFDNLFDTLDFPNSPFDYDYLFEN